MIRPIPVKESFLTGLLPSRGWLVWFSEIVNGLNYLDASATLDFSSIASLSHNDQTLTLKGVRENHTVFLGLPPTPTTGIIFQAFISADDTVTIRATNITGGAIDPASATYRVRVFIGNA